MMVDARMLAIALVVLGACAQGAGDEGGTASPAPTPSTTAVGSPGGMGGSDGGAGGTAATGGAPPDGATPRQGELVFVELFPDPAGLSDFDAEWFELKNVTDQPLSLDRCRLMDRDVDGDDLSLAGAGIVIAPGAVALFAKKADPSVNGGLTDVVYAFGNDFSLGNGGDEARLECDAIRIDEVAYTTSWPFGAGRSMQLRPASEDASSNDDPANWCTATTSYAPGELGSPGVDAQCN